MVIVQLSREYRNQEVLGWNIISIKFLNKRLSISIPIVHFYLPHMEFEGSIGLVTEKRNFFIVYFHVLGLFIANKHSLSEKKIRLSRATAVAAAVERKICATPTA
jgi:hypothetical protein